MTDELRRLARNVVEAWEKEPDWPGSDGLLERRICELDAELCRSEATPGERDLVVARQVANYVAMGPGRVDVENRIMRILLDARIDERQRSAAAQPGEVHPVEALLRDVVDDVAPLESNFRCIVCGSNHHPESDGDPSCSVSKALAVLYPPESLTSEECTTCKRPEDAVNHVPGCIFVGWGHGWQTCPDCGGSQRRAAAKGGDHG